MPIKYCQRSIIKRIIECVSIVRFVQDWAKQKMHMKQLGRWVWKEEDDLKSHRSNGSDRVWYRIERRIPSLEYNLLICNAIAGLFIVWYCWFLCIDCLNISSLSSKRLQTSAVIIKRNAIKVFIFPTHKNNFWK